MSKADSPTKTCQPCMEESDRVRPMRARVDDVPMCSSHYNRARYTPEQRYQKKHKATCSVCGKQWFSERPGRKLCSDECRSADYKTRGFRPEPGATWSPRRRASVALARAARGSSGRHWVAGNCGRCGASFIAPYGSDLGRYCSETCKRRARGSRRRARERGAHHVPYSRVAIFERDGYRCHLCKRRTLPTAVVPHPRAPVIDHLVPLGTGHDAPYNVATACFLCNSRRREVGPAQLILFG